MKAHSVTPQSKKFQAELQSLEDHLMMCLRDEHRMMSISYVYMYNIIYTSVDLCI